MADEKPPELPPGSHRITADSPSPMESLATVKASASASMTLYAGIPGKTGEESMAFYRRVETIEPTHISGFYGVIMYGEAIDLFMHGGDPEKPVTRMRMSSTEFVDFADAIHELKEKRFGRRV